MVPWLGKSDFASVACVWGGGVKMEFRRKPTGEWWVKEKHATPAAVDLRRIHNNNNNNNNKAYAGFRLYQYPSHPRRRLSSGRAGSRRANIS